MTTTRSKRTTPALKVGVALLVLVLLVLALVRSGLLHPGTSPSIKLSLPRTIPARVPFEGAASIGGTPPLQVRASLPAVHVTSAGDVSWPRPEPGEYTVVFTIRNAAGEARDEWDVAVVAEPVRIVSSPRTDAVPRQPYEYPVAVQGTPPFGWELPQAPDGMTVDDHGVVRMPADRMTGGAEYTVTVRVRNAVADRQHEDTQTFTVRCRKAEKPKSKQRQMKVASMTKEKAPPPPTPPPTPPKPPEEKRLEEERRIAEQRKKDEEHRRQEQIRREVEERRKLEEERRRHEEGKQRLEEEARLRAEAEQRRRREEERKRQKAARDAQLAQAAEREEARRLEQERLRREQEEKEEELRRQEEETARLAQERRRIEQERLREAQKRAKAEAERKEQEAGAKREAEMRRLREEARRRQEEAEELRAQRVERRRQQEAREKLMAEQKRLQAERARQEQEAAKRADDERVKRQQEEARRRHDDALAQKVDEGKKVEFSWYRFIFGGTLAEFINLAGRLDIVVLFVALEGEALDLDRTPYLVTGVDRSGRALTRSADSAGMSRRLGSGYNLKGVRLVAVANGPDWAGVDSRLSREKGVSGYWTLAFFPYALIADLARSAHTFYDARRVDRSLPFEKGAGRITFTVGRGGNVEILSMANTR